MWITKVHSNTQCLTELWLIMEEISRQLWTPSVLLLCAAGKNNTYHNHFSLQMEMKYDYACSALPSCVPLMPGVNISFTSKDKTKDLTVNDDGFFFLKRKRFFLIGVSEISFLMTLMANSIQRLLHLEDCKSTANLGFRDICRFPRVPHRITLWWKHS